MARQVDFATSIPAGNRIGLALGGGGARGIAHIAVLEAFDELGVKPAVIAGTSIGAILGWAYASGLPARALRQELLGRLRDKRGVVARIFEARVGRFVHLVSGRGNPMSVDAEVLLRLLMPPNLVPTFEELPIPLAVVATDFHARCEMVFRSGPILPAVAGSAAVPGLVRPVVHGGRVLIDGGAINPLPFDQVEDNSDVIIAVDVTRGATDADKPVPDSWETMFASLQILQGTIVQAKVARRAPDALIRPDVNQFRVLDFFKAGAILRAAEPTKEEVKRMLEKLLT
jgi:NTE family protein